MPHWLETIGDDAFYRCEDLKEMEIPNGTKTFGKGIVQNVLPIGTEGAGFQITIAEYFTPKGNKVHEVGITPDVIVERPEEDTGNYDFADLENDIQLRKALEVTKENLK